MNLDLKLTAIKWNSKSRKINCFDNLKVAIYANIYANLDKRLQPHKTQILEANSVC